VTLKENLLRTAVMGAMASVVKDINDAQRKTLLDELLTHYRETGNKSYSVALPSGDKAANLTLNESKPETRISNEDVFFNWCAEHRPDLLETIEHDAVPAWTQTIEHPATEAWTEVRVLPAAAAHVVKDYRLAGDMYVTDEGEPVDGIEYTPAPEPSKFTLTYTAKDRGLSMVQAWRDGLIPITLDKNLPQVGVS
jgi:hypothetical protein